MAQGSSSPTHIPYKVDKNERFIPKGNVYERVTEDDALGAQKPKPRSTILGAAFEEDVADRIRCEYNLGVADNLYGASLVRRIAGRVGCFVSKVYKQLESDGKSLGKT